MLLPLYSDTYSAGLMAISDDEGKTWTASKPLAAFGGIQPAVVQREDGTAGGVHARERPAAEGAGVRVEGRRRDLGHGRRRRPAEPRLRPRRGAAGERPLAARSTTTRSKGRNSLAVSISDDEGKTWKWTRHLEKHDAGSYHYPAIIQAKDGGIHAVYSYFVAGGKSMKHARFTEAWVKEGDK